MIPQSEIQTAAGRYGVAEPQVWRDWFISHLLLALATVQHETPIVFYGGTALCRTWCPGLRLSEDLDLLVDDFEGAIELIPARLRAVLRREFPDMTWSAAEPTDRMVTALVQAGARSVKAQLVEPRQREDRIPTISTEVDLRYSDLPATVTLRVPSAEGFAAMKLMAWHQRQAPRDLVDLSALAGIGAITANAVDLTKQISGIRINKRVLQQRIPPSVLTYWDTQLAHQMASIPRPDECLDRVLAGLDEVDS